MTDARTVWLIRNPWTGRLEAWEAPRLEVRRDGSNTLVVASSRRLDGSRINA